MACGYGCGNRADVIRGALSKHAADQAARQQAAAIARRASVVAQHAARDLGRLARSAILRKGK
jgi:hypothetical protein